MADSSPLPALAGILIESLRAGNPDTGLPWLTWSELTDYVAVCPVTDTVWTVTSTVLKCWKVKPSGKKKVVYTVKHGLTTRNVNCLQRAVHAQKKVVSDLLRQNYRETGEFWQNI